MADFTKNKSWAETQVIEDNADASDIGKTASQVSTDLNSQVLNEYFSFGSAVPNSPFDFGTGISIRSASNEGIQITGRVNGDQISFRRQTSGNYQPWIEFLHTANAASLPITTAFAPTADNTHSLGDVTGRWSEVFAGNDTINTSDAREKTEIAPFTFDEIEASKQLANEIGTYKFLASIEAKGDSARTHIGLTVQKAIEIMAANNLDPMSYGFICFNSWDEEVEAILDSEGEAVLDENEQPTYEVTKEAGDRYGVRYNQLNQFILAGFNARLEAAGI